MCGVNMEASDILKKIIQLLSTESTEENETSTTAETTEPTTKPTPKFNYFTTEKTAEPTPKYNYFTAEKTTEPTPKYKYFTVTTDTTTGKLSSVIRQAQTHNLLKIRPPPEPVVCSLCQKSFTKLFNLASHLRTHAGNKPYSCSLCPKTFRHKSGLNSHKRFHQGERRFACSHCPKSFVRSSNLKQHFAVHHAVKGYPCADCPEAFSTSVKLALHRRRLHDPEKPFVCTQNESGCQKRFASRWGLRQHLRAQHKILLTYECSKCDQRFRLQVELLDHQSTHDQDEDEDDDAEDFSGFSYCGYCTCGKTFSCRDKFYRHRKRRGHSRAKVHECPICLMTFKTIKKGLEPHYYTHDLKTRKMFERSGHS